MKDIMDILNPKTEIDMKIDKELGDLKKNFSILLMMPKEKYESVYLLLTKKLLKEFGKGIYVTVNKESAELISEMKDEKINTDKIIFVDAVTEMVSEDEVEDTNVSYLSSPNDLMEMDVTIEEKMGDVKDGFLIFDSLTTLAVYNDEKTVEKFVHSLSQKTKGSKICDVFLIMKHSREEFVETISQFFDKIVEL